MNGELTSDFLDQFLATVLAKGSSDKVIFTGTHRRVLHLAASTARARARSGSRPARTSTASRWTASSPGVFGYEIPVVVKKEWSNYPSGDNGYNGNLFVVDMTNVEREPLRDRDTKLLHEPPEPRRRQVRRRVPDGAELGDRAGEDARPPDRHQLGRNSVGGRVDRLPAPRPKEDTCGSSPSTRTT